MPSENLIAELADEYDVKVVQEEDVYEDEAGSFENTDQSSTYGLRGSSFNEEPESSDSTYWTKMYCEAKQRKDYWKKKMGETTGEAREDAETHYSEAKAATLRAKSRLTSEAKSAWEKVKETSSSAYSGAI